MQDLNIFPYLLWYHMSVPEDGNLSVDVSRLSFAHRTLKLSFILSCLNLLADLPWQGIISESGSVVLVRYYASWCHACKRGKWINKSGVFWIWVGSNHRLFVRPDLQCKHQEARPWWCRVKWWREGRNGNEIGGWWWFGGGCVHICGRTEHRHRKTHGSESKHPLTSVEVGMHANTSTYIRR